MKPVLEVGVDEAARGSIAGPMIFCVLHHKDPDKLLHLGAKDSKTSTERQRFEFYQAMIQEREKRLAGWTFAVISPDDLDAQGYSNAIADKVAVAVARFMQNAKAEVKILMDGSEMPLNIPPWIETRFIPRGDVYEPLISAASMMAKALHDDVMRELTQKYPDWHFESHKGYYTDAHMAVLYERGPTPVHRRIPTITATKTWSKKRGIEPPSWLNEYVNGVYLDQFRRATREQDAS